MAHILYYLIAFCLSVLNTQITQPIKMKTKNSISKITESIEFELIELDSIKLKETLKFYIPTEEEINNTN